MKNSYKFGKREVKEARIIFFFWEGARWPAPIIHTFALVWDQISVNGAGPELSAAPRQTCFLPRPHRKISPQHHAVYNLRFLVSHWLIFWFQVCHWWHCLSLQSAVGTSRCDLNAFRIFVLHSSNRPIFDEHSKIVKIGIGTLKTESQTRKYNFSIGSLESVFTYHFVGLNVSSL